jgi:WD40 repeat protein
MVLVGDTETALVLDEQTLAIRRELRLGARAAIAALDDRGRVAVGDANGSIRVFDSASNEPIHDFVAHPKSPVQALTFLSDGSLASAGGDSTVSTWSLPGGERRLTTAGMFTIGFTESPSGRRLLACPMRGNPRVLHGDDLRTLIELVGHESGLFLCGIVSLGDGRFVTGDSAGALRVWSEQSLRSAR